MTAVSATVLTPSSSVANSTLQLKPSPANFAYWVGPTAVISGEV